MKEIETIFNLLGNWRKLPKYQLERRLDIFFALYLPEILKNKINIDIDYKDIIPEFPLKEKNNALSTNADYAIFCKNEEKTKLYLLELKTDMNSIKDKQIAYYKRAKKKGFLKILNDIIKIQKKTSHWSKYDKLLEHIEKNNYNIIKSNVATKNQKRKNWEIDEKNIINDIEIIYLIPKEDNKIDKTKTITFENVINILNALDNKSEISKEFCKILEKLI